MDDLIDRFKGLDEVEMPDVWTKAAIREPLPPSRIPMARRVAIAVFALGLAVAAIGFAVAALREADPRTEIGNSSDHLVPSGGTYSLSGFAVEFPSEPGPDGSGPVAAVTLGYEWTSDTFPGEAQCEVRLLDEQGSVIAVHETGFAALPRRGRSAPITIPVPSGTPVSAEGECAPGLVFDGRSEYRFTNLRFEQDRLVGDVSWSEGTPVGHAACATKVTSPSGQVSVTTFTMSAGPFEAQTIVLGDFPEGGAAQVRCEPYRVPGQLKESHWLPWTDLQIG